MITIVTVFCLEKLVKLSFIRNLVIIDVSLEIASNQNGSH